MHWGILWGKSQVPNQNRVSILLDHRILLVRDDCRKTSSSTPCSEQHQWDHCSGPCPAKLWVSPRMEMLQKAQGSLLCLTTLTVFPSNWNFTCSILCSLSSFHYAPLSKVWLSSPHLLIRLLSMPVRSPLHLPSSRLNRPSSLRHSYTMCSRLPQPGWSTTGLTPVCQHLSCTQGPQTRHSHLVWDHSTRHLEVPDRGEESLFPVCWLQSGLTQPWIWLAFFVCKVTLQQIHVWFLVHQGSQVFCKCILYSVTSLCCCMWFSHFRQRFWSKCSKTDHNTKTIITTWLASLFLLLPSIHWHWLQSRRTLKQLEWTKGHREKT